MYNYRDAGQGRRWCLSCAQKTYICAFLCMNRFWIYDVRDPSWYVYIYIYIYIHIYICCTYECIWMYMHIQHISRNSATKADIRCNIYMHFFCYASARDCATCCLRERALMTLTRSARQSDTERICGAWHTKTLFLSPEYNHSSMMPLMPATTLVID